MRSILSDAALAAAMAAGAVAALPWARERFRFVIAAIGTYIGFVVWNLTLNVTHASGFNTDAPVIRLSWADTGSGVFSFAFVIFLLTLSSGSQPAKKVVGAAALAGLAAVIVDIFVL